MPQAFGKTLRLGGWVLNTSTPCSHMFEVSDQKIKQILKTFKVTTK